SNPYALAAATAECRAQPVLLGIARDNCQALRRKIKQGLGADVLVISGGISMGNADFVGTVIQECGVKVQFAKVRQRPGQPFTYGLFKSKPVFCLPGNPVSALLVFEIYIRPALLRMMGSQAPSRQKITATIVRDICVKPGKTYFLRVRIWSRAGAFYAGLTGPQGSGIMKSMVSADGILIVPDTVERIKKGEQWPIILL
ncbi:MAG: molybdopterin-binding protein, partial [Candidatus Omnitrophica bacterium]|nr:molybdopterin-binding protein [Candidatus Omnitrophota bacterium]